MSDSNELLPQDPGWDYGDILPLARNRQTGQLSLAIPGALRGAVNDLALAATVPGRVASGQMSLQQAAPLVPRMALGLAGMGGMGEAPEGALRIFAGRTAKTADTAALSRAMSMESQGHAPGAIWDSTGWMKGPDGQWRFEIPDTKAHLGEYQSGPLSDVMRHDLLYKAYPDLEQIPVSRVWTNKFKGAYTPGSDKIEIASHQESGAELSTLLHETQHAIQSREGFASGGSPDDFLTPQFHNEHFAAKQLYQKSLDGIAAAGGDPAIIQRAVTKNIVGSPLSNIEEQHLNYVSEENPDVINDMYTSLNKLAKLGEQRAAATESYRNLAGEVEARNVQERHASGETAYPPSTPGYTPWEQQIVKFDHEGNAIPTHRLIPVEHDPFQAFPVEHDPFAAASTVATPTGFSNIKPPVENIRDLIDANFVSGNAIGNDTVPLSSLKWGTSQGDDPKRISYLVKQISAPEGYWARPVIDQDGNVVEGQHRVAAAQAMGVQNIPVYRVRDNFAGKNAKELTDTIAQVVPKIPRQSAAEIGRHAAEMLSETGSAEKAFEEYEIPKAHTAHYTAAFRHLNSEPTQ